MQRKHILSALIATLATAPALAGPADYIYTPTVEYGEKEIDFKFGTAGKKGEPRESASSLGFGYGATPWWFTEIYAKWKRENNEGTKYDAFEWENKFQLTETGKYPVDIGFLVEIERPRVRAEGWELKYGPLFQTEFGKVQLNLNTLFERSYRAEAPSDLKFIYQFQAKYRYAPSFEFGVQGIGEMGKWNHWARAGESEQKIGPAIFGKIKLDGHQAVKYNAAYLVGTTNHTADGTFRTQVEYEF